LIKFESWVWGSGLRVQGVEFWVDRIRVLGVGLRAEGAGCRVQNIFRVVRRVGECTGGAGQWGERRI
jgi:hypothetical protein